MKTAQYGAFRRDDDTKFLNPGINKLPSFNLRLPFVASFVYLSFTASTSIVTG